MNDPSLLRQLADASQLSVSSTHSFASATSSRAHVTAPTTCSRHTREELMGNARPETMECKSDNFSIEADSYDECCEKDDAHLRTMRTCRWDLSSCSRPHNHRTQTDANFPVINPCTWRTRTARRDRRPAARCSWHLHQTRAEYTSISATLAPPTITTRSYHENNNMLRNLLQHSYGHT